MTKLLEYLPLILRIIVFNVAPLIGLASFADFDVGMGTLTIHLEEFTVFLVAATASVISGITFWISRIAKRHGGKT